MIVTHADTLRALLREDDSADTFERAQSAQDRAVRGYGKHVVDALCEALVVPRPQQQDALFAAVQRCLSRLRHAVKRTFRAIFARIAVAVVRDHIEDGMPFTLSRVVFVPVSLTTSPDLGDTLLHEAVHVHQRLYPDDTRRLLARMGYAPYVAEFPIALSHRCNPDTVQHRFWERDGRVYTAVFDGNRLRHARYVSVSATDGTIEPARHEHPYEQMAYAVVDVLGTPAAANHLALRLWLLTP